VPIHGGLVDSASLATRGRLMYSDISDRGAHVKG
jgi:hypothetical protein